jgi:hypothetical protein
VCWGLLTVDAADFWLACTGVITCKGCVRAGKFIIVFPSNSPRGVRYGSFSILYMPSLFFFNVWSPTDGKSGFGTAQNGVASLTFSCSIRVTLRHAPSRGKIAGFVTSCMIEIELHVMFF